MSNAKNLARGYAARARNQAEAESLARNEGYNESTTPKLSEINTELGKLNSNFYKGGSGSSNTGNQPSSPFEQLYQAEQGRSRSTTRLSDEDVFKGSLADLSGNSTKMLDEIIKQVQRESDLRTQINEKIGLSGKLSEDFRKSIEASIPNALTLGYGFDSVVNLITRMGEQSGRFNLLSKQTLDNTYAVARAFVGELGNLADLFTEFEKVGQGANDTLDAISRSGMASLSLGLNSKKTTDMLKDNIGKLNEYGFKNGVDGLNRMVQRSIEFRMNVGEAFKVADNVMDPEKALALTANLQVLGGAIGDFNDPLKLMYMATNNVEGLQNALIDAASGLATYNNEQGKFEITGVNLRRAREMAAQLGVDYKELAKGAIASQERQLANNQLLSKGLDIPKADREFITNMSQMKGGQMVITIPENVANKIGAPMEIALNDLTAKQIEQLKGVKKELEDKSPLQIAKDQFSLVQNMENMLQGIYRTVVTDVTNLTVGQNGGELDLNKIFEGLSVQASKVYTAAQSEKSPLFDFAQKIAGTISATVNNLVGPSKDIFMGFADKKLEEFLKSSVGVKPEEMQKKFAETLDAFNQNFKKLTKEGGRVPTYQSRVTINNNTNSDMNYYQEQTRNSYDFITQDE